VSVVLNEGHPSSRGVLPSVCVCVCVCVCLQCEQVQQFCTYTISKQKEVKKKERMYD
jgi:hypothetical protein